MKEPLQATGDLQASCSLHTPSRLAFIGGGNMAGSLISGLVRANYPPDFIHVVDPHPEKLALLHRQYGVHIKGMALQAADQADILLLAVKPQKMREVCQSLASRVTSTSPIVISIAAGITLKQIRRWLGSSQASVIRAMPNTPAKLGYGMTALFSDNPNLKNATIGEKVQQLFEQVGQTLWLDDEDSLNTATVISGSGPACFFLLMEQMEQAAQKMGLKPEAASILVRRSALGAAALATHNNPDLASLRLQVTSPGGTTEQVITHFQAGGLAQLIEQGLIKGQRRAIELAAGAQGK